MIKNTWCSLPWQGIVIQPWGKVQMCCYTDTVSANNITDYLNLTSLHNTKKQMLEGKQPEVCRVCWKTEMYKKKSWRIKKNHQLEHQLTDLQKQTLEFHSFDYIELYISNKCNSKCRMCKPKWSTHWFADYKDPIIKEIFNYSEEVEKQVVKYNSLSIDQLDQLADIVNSKSSPTTISLRGGEPVYAEETFYLLEKIKNKNLVSIDLTTNGTIFNDKIFSLLKQFNNIHLGVSIDATDKLNRYIRGNDTPIKKLFENTKKFLQLPNISYFFISNVIMIYNTFDNNNLKEACLQGLGFKPNYDDKFLFNPMHLKSHILPTKLKEKIPTDWLQNSIIKDPEDSQLITKWRKWTTQLDKIRGESLVEIEPIFKEMYYG
jgi:MoaA/NifB/PqqE/SkfB family radical SAM enzyme